MSMLMTSPACLRPRFRIGTPPSANRFFAVSPAALTLRGFADSVAAWFGLEPRYELVSWKKWLEICDLPADAIAETEDHLRHGQCCSMGKADRLLGFRPRFSSLEAVKESVDWLVENGHVTVVPGS
jgi:nucleoside-diphosphate-sugar epimerase